VLRRDGSFFSRRGEGVSAAGKRIGGGEGRSSGVPPDDDSGKEHSKTKKEEKDFSVLFQRWTSPDKQKKGRERTRYSEKRKD